MEEKPSAASEPVKSEPTKTSKVDYTGRFKQPDILLTLGGGILIVAGSFLAWATANVLFFKASVSGIDGDGKYTAIAGGLVLLLAILSKTIWNTNKQFGNKVHYLFLALALAAFGIFAYDTTQLLSVNTGGMIKLGVGLYLIPIGAVLTFVGAVKNIFKVKKQFGFIALGVIAAVVVGTSVFGYVNKQNFNATNNFGNAFANIDTTESNNWSSSLQTQANNNTHPSNEAAPTITVLTKTFKQDDYSPSTGYVLGEIKNGSNTDAYIKDITTTLYAKGKAVASSTASYYPMMLKKNDTGAYKSSIDNLPVYDEIKVTVDSASASSYWLKCSYLNVVSQSARQDDYGSLAVTGEADNNTGKTHSYVNVYVWLVGNDNNVVDVTNTYIDTINSGETKPFEATFYSGGQYNYKTSKVLAEACD